MTKTATKQLVVCIKNDGYLASLEKRKIYVVLRDAQADERGFVRIIDESGDDYLYPKNLFARLPCRRRSKGPCLTLRDRMRSLLFVPADGGSKLDKALGAGADGVILDLEDSIAPERKSQARAAALDFLKSAQAKKDRPRLLVRINGLDTGMTDADLDAVVAGRPDAIVFPKAEGGASVVHLDAKLTAREAIAGLPEGSIKILAQTVESAAGLFAAGTYRDCSARLIGMTWGPEDLSAELGAEANRDAAGELTEPYRLARTMCLYGAAAAKVPAIETIHVDFRNLDALRRDTEMARRDGFAGRLAIHPAQVAVINAVFTPSAEQIEKAKALVAAFAAKPGAGTIGIDGKMFDRPHLLRAQRLLSSLKS